MLNRWVHHPMNAPSAEPCERRSRRTWPGALAVVLALSACSESDDPARDDSSDGVDEVDVGDATGDSPEGDEGELPDGDEGEQDEDEQGDEGPTRGQLDAGVDGGKRDGGKRDGSAAPAEDAAADASADATTDAPDGSDVDASGDGGIDASTTPDASGPGVIKFNEPGPYAVERENNIGEDFANDVRDDSAICRILLPGLVGDNATPEQIDEAVAYPAEQDRRLYTVWRPATLEDGKRYPVVTWGNGTCGLPSSYADLLAHIASHGFIVIAPNYRQIGNGDLMLRALEVLRAEDERQGSALYGKVDLEHVGASGHSQGAGSAVAVSDEQIIDAVVAVEGGGSGTNGKPTFFIAGADDAVVTPATVRSAYNGVRGPAAYGLRADADHITPIDEAEKMWGPVTAWFKAQLEEDETARAYFDDTCTLCDDPDWTLERKNLE